METTINQSKTRNRDLTYLCHKNVLTIDEAVLYTGFKKSYIYKLTHQSVLPFSKPNGRTIFFERAALEKWMLTGRTNSQDEQEEKAEEFINKSIVKRI